jgi:hypothetical protein
MLSDPGITLAGHTITMFQLLLAGGVLLGAAALLLALAHGKRIALQRSVVTDEMAIQLGRIADSLEHLANETAVWRQAATTRQSTVSLPPKPGEEAHPISYSMFGR